MITANAASYNTHALTRPIPIHTAYRASTVWTWDQARSSRVPAMEPPVIRARPPWRSSHRPTGTAAAAEASTEAVNAPATMVVLVCRAAAMGMRKTANA